MRPVNNCSKKSGAQALSVAIIILVAGYKLRDDIVDKMAKCNAGEITRKDCEEELKGAEL